MTIEYKDSKRISALAADTKPTNVETNSILVEKDTGNRFWYDGTTWTNPVCISSISSTSTLGTAADMDTDVGSPSKSNSGLGGCNAWDFNGTDMAVMGMLGSDFAATSTSTFTMAGWIKPDDVTADQVIFSKAANLSGGYATALMINTTGNLEILDRRRGYASLTTATTNTMSAGTWYHIAYIKNGTTLTCYLNAVTGSKGSRTGATSGTNDTDDAWGFGTSYDGGTASVGWYNGMIDSFTLWDIALSEANITTLYNSGTAITPTVSTNDIVAHWTFSETSGTAVNKAV